MTAYLDHIMQKPGPLTTAQISAIFGELDDQLKSGRFNEVDATLRSADPRTMHEDAIVALARYPFMARDRLPSWAGFVRRAKAVLAERGAADALRGLNT